MLILSRQQNQSIVISDDIRITIHEIRGGRVKLAIEAPRCIRVLRGEHLEKTEEEVAGVA